MKQNILPTKLSIIRSIPFIFFGILFLSNYQVNAQDNAILLEAEEADVLGSDFDVVTEDDVTFITPSTDLIDGSFPGSADKVASFTVTFDAPGTYDLYVKVRVGPEGFDDDSFFFANSFGDKAPSETTDWVRVNGIGNGAANTDEYIVSPEENIAGNEIFKWINASEVGEGENGPTLFVIEEANLTQTFQVGSRENGLDIDKLAFGNADLYYTVSNLENEEAGVTEVPEEEGPDPIAFGQNKFLGSGYTPGDFNFDWYWNQVTPGNAGKWGSVEGTRDQMNWAAMDATYNLAKENGFYIKFHVLVWGNQQPAWIEDLPAEEQLAEIREWFEAVAERYPDLDAIEVVNEPLHDPPNQAGNGGGNYIEALGGNGTTGWDWIITSFELAREIFPPTTQLMINDYGIVSDGSATSDYLEIITLLQDRDLIDQIGVQGHAFNLNNANPNTVNNNLNSLGATGLPVFVTEFDLDGLDDYLQLQRFQRIFPVIWENEHVEGVTVWGYVASTHWRADEGAYLINPNGTLRPSLIWLRAYVEGNFIEISDLTITSEGSTTIEIPNNTLQLTAEFTPENPTISDIAWSSSNESVAIVDDEGLVSGLGEGSATITARALDGSEARSTIIITVESVEQLLGLYDEALKIYPNPSTNRSFKIMGLSPSIDKIRILDLSGREIHSKNVFGEQELEFNLDVNPGIYSIQLLDGEKILNRTIIVN